MERKILFVIFITTVVAISGCVDQSDSNTNDRPGYLNPETNNSVIIFLPYEFLYDGYTGYEYRISFCDPDPRAGPTCGGIEPATNPTGGSPPYSFSVGYGAGLLPPGMKLNLNGVLEGTPTLAGKYNFEICAKDGQNNQACNTFNLRVNDPIYLTVLWTGDGSGSVEWSEAIGNSTCEEASGEGSYKCVVPMPLNTEVAVTAKADENSVFNSWGRSCSGAGTCNIYMDADKILTADFSPLAENTGTTPPGQAGTLAIAIDSISLTKCDVVQGGFDDGMRYYTVTASGTATGGDSDRTTSLDISILETRNAETTSYGTDTLDCGAWTWTDQDGYTYPYCLREQGQPETTTWTVTGKGAGSNVEHVIGVRASVRGYESGKSAYYEEEKDAGVC